MELSGCKAFTSSRHLVYKGLDFLQSASSLPLYAKRQDHNKHQPNWSDLNAHASILQIRIPLRIHHTHLHIVSASIRYVYLNIVVDKYAYSQIISAILTFHKPAICPTTRTRSHLVVLTLDLLFSLVLRTQPWSTLVIRNSWFSAWLTQPVLFKSVHLTSSYLHSWSNYHKDACYLVLQILYYHFQILTLQGWPCCGCWGTWPEVRHGR